MRAGRDRAANLTLGKLPCEIHMPPGQSINATPPRRAGTDGIVTLSWGSEPAMQAAGRKLSVLPGTMPCREPGMRNIRLAHPVRRRLSAHPRITRQS